MTRIRIPRETRRFVIFFLLVAPALTLRFATAVYPVYETIKLSFLEVNLLTRTRRFVGLENFVQMIRDPSVTEVMGFTLALVASSVLLQLLLGMGIATLLNASFRGRHLLRSINLIPWAIPTVVAGLAFRWMLDDQYGMITDLIYRISGQRPELLIHPLSSQLSVVLVNVWKNTPFMAVVLLAGLQSVPQELYEAARIDGATSWQGFRHITVPVSTPLIITLSLFFVIWQLANFDLILGLTHGGPGIATTVISYRIFQEGMLWYKWGYASALGVGLMLIVALIGCGGLYLFRRFDVRF